MKLEVGKKYLNRRGEVIKIVTNDQDDTYPFEDEKCYSYTENGRADIRGETPDDLIREFKERKDMSVDNDNTLHHSNTKYNAKKKITVTYDNVDEDTVRNFVGDAMEECGVHAGQLIPSDMLRLREALIKVMFGEKE